MDRTRYERMYEIFALCLEAPEEKRDTVLNRATNGDEELRRDVERLLEQDASAFDDLFADSAIKDAQVAIAAFAEQVESSQEQNGVNQKLPTKIGQYTIQRVIGRGGMGIVYEGRQEKPSRTVAIKVMRSDMTSPGQVRRFEREVQALGKLRHPGIAHIYEAGETTIDHEQRPFLAMEFVEGPTIDAYVDEQHLDPGAILELIALVCDALQHAHHRGVIHRDLKPSNILVVQPSGQPKILDFGVALVTDADVHTLTRRTQTGQFIGTPAYMSPEQVRGDSLDLDTRCDVYALGVLMYELLAGEAPFDFTTTPLAMSTRIILQDDPLRLGSVKAVLRGDIETIVAKAMEKDRDRRYGSAGELAADIRRFLCDDPIEARPASNIYRLRKFTQRNRALVGGAVMAIAALVIGLVLAMGGFLSARAERDEKVQALEVAQAVTDFLAEMMAAANPGAQGKDVTMREVVGLASSTIGERFADQPLVEAKLRTTIGETYVGLGDYEAAEEQLNTAVTILKRERSSDHPELLEAEDLLATTWYFMGRLDDAEQLLEEVLQRAQQRNQSGREELVTYLGNLAHVRSRSGKLESAAKLFQEAIEVQRSVVSDDDPIAIDLASNLANLYSFMNRVDDAERVYRENLERSKRLRGEDHPETLLIAANLGGLYSRGDVGRYDDAIDLLESTLEAQERVLGEAHSKTLITLFNLAMAHRRRGEVRKTFSLFQLAIHRTEGVYASTEPSTTMLMDGLSGLYQEFRGTSKSIEFLNECLESARSTSGNDRFELATMIRLAELLFESDEQEQAIAYGIELLSRLDAADLTPRWHFRGRIVSARALLTQNNFAGAEAILLECSERVDGALQSHVNELLSDLYEAMDHRDDPEPM